MYGLVTIWLAASMAATTSGGAPTGGIAIPFTIFAFGAGWNAGSVGDTPPLLPVVVPPEVGVVVDVSPNAAAGSRHAQAKASTASKSGLSARFGKVSFARLPG